VNDVLLNKKASIERCASQVRRYYDDAGAIPFAEDHLRQDAIAMNLQRVCDLAIDMANHLVRAKKLGLPQDSRDAFELLRQTGIIAEPMSTVLKSMVGFRNVLVHEYRKFELEIMIDVITNRLDEILDFANVCVAAGPS
jgi:uncharacterized protein YutE (UPF0331/DUF86 family)